MSVGVLTFSLYFVQYKGQGPLKSVGMLAFVFFTIHGQRATQARVLLSEFVVSERKGENKRLL